MMHHKPICLGITGGIGSGKSYICRMLEERGIPIFYTDDEAKLEMKENNQIHQDLIQLIGNDVIKDGLPVKSVLSSYICQGNEYAQRVNAIVHPRVKERTLRWKQFMADKKQYNIIGIECALLFESGFSDICDKIVTIAAPLDTRINRIVKRDSIDRSKALEWINLQMPQEEKISLSDFVINNDGIEELKQQIDSMINNLKA